MTLFVVAAIFPAVGAPGLYAIVDADACERTGLAIDETAFAMLDAGIAILQVRAKDRPAIWLSRAVEKILNRRGAGGPRIFVNDRADIALLAGADGVHVGQDDLPPQAVRHVMPRLLVGWSTHDLTQLSEGLAMPVSYVAYGPVFSTSSKKNPEREVSPSGLRDAAVMCRRARVALVAIGGIRRDNLPLVAPHCDFVAAIAALLPPVGCDQPYGRVRHLCEQFVRDLAGAALADSGALPNNGPSTR